MGVFPEVVDGPRLTLRAWRPDDVPALQVAIAASLDHLRPWMAWAQHELLDATTRTEMIESWNRRGEDEERPYGAFREGEIVGGCGLHRRSDPDTLEIGYWIHVDHIRNGYATEAARLLTDVAFTVPGIRRVEIHHDRANVASRRVPVALGYTLEHERADDVVAPGEVGIDLCWAMDVDDWNAEL